MLSSIKSLALFALATTVANAAVVTYNWNVTYVDNVNADGLAARRVIGINGQFPPPAINVTLNDTLVINVINQLDVPTALHSHGLFQTRNGFMDGPAMVTQCPIPAGANFTYTIPIENHGTYWIHGHIGGQYVDGLRAPLIIHNTNETYKYDAEYTVALADWYHTEHSELLAWYLSIFNPSGAEPVPKSALINQATGAVFDFVPGKTYRIRVINMSALAMFHFHIDGHDMKVIEIDGIDVEPFDAASFPITAAQRYSVLVTAKNTTTSNFLLHADMDPSMFDSVPDDLALNITGLIQYNASAPTAPEETSEWLPFDDAALVPVVAEPSSAPDVSIVLTAFFTVMDDYINKASFNEITYVMPKVPSLYTALSTGNLSSDPTVYGTYAHPIVIKHGQVVELIINNNDPGNHPFHLHGHVFQIIGRQDAAYDPANPYPDVLPNPARRDTALIPSDGSMAIRFVANNPGVWLFHCHIEWHLQAGLAVTIIEAPEVMSDYVTIPQSHKDQCAQQGIPSSGNAAGKEGLDLNGMSLGANMLSGTFQAKGIVALVFTIICAIGGLATVIWYSREDESVIAAQMAQAKKEEALSETPSK